MKFNEKDLKFVLNNPEGLDKKNPFDVWGSKATADGGIVLRNNLDGTPKFSGMISVESKADADRLRDILNGMGAI